MKFLAKYLPWGAAILVLLIPIVMVFGPSGKVRAFDTKGFGSLPIQEGGRIKPLNSLARNSMLVIHSRQGLRHEGRFVGPDEWMLDTLFRPEEAADNQALFVIDDLDVLGLIKAQQTKNRNYFSFRDLGPNLEEIQRQASNAEGKPPQKRSRFEAAVVHLFNRIYLFYRLRNTLQMAGSPGLGWELQSLGAPDAAVRQQEMDRLAHFRILPPAQGMPPDAWMSVGQALNVASAGGGLHPGLPHLAMMSHAYQANDPATFNTALAQFQSAVKTLSPEAMEKASYEVVFNQAQPFLVGMIAFLMAFLVICISWIWKPEIFRPTAFSLLLAGAIMQTLGLAMRVHLSGYAPVTNLYSSAVFVGWGIVVLGLIVERIYRSGFGTAVASIAGFATLIVAQNLGESGDTMEMMRAVLDSNFWLSTHVTTITIGYAGTFLAGAIAIAYAIRKHIVSDPDPETDKTLVGMAYGIICFALFFSFVGTVLGGIWADQSWGRFWGWDPKENGALLIVLWNAIILHARMAGYVRDRGLMVMAIFGNIITAASWFGVNLLGVGLHAYGFTDKGFMWLAGFWLSQILFMALCYAPARFWISKPGAQA